LKEQCLVFHWPVKFHCKPVRLFFLARRILGEAAFFEERAIQSSQLARRKRREKSDIRLAGWRLKLLTDFEPGSMWRERHTRAFFTGGLCNLRIIVVANLEKKIY